ncbi:NADH dehydrogenase [ubiquinone] 1 alpha subcomplex subunit 10, mitochondrial [Phlebotomus argentipes]|uniref:NADH dehydrogenase [ubiquinone] 1 alpha subcomplex subunit 10, mitochondrial n=1 Tax=Phlebotomus argentipes TaxID=94469 RepID=UPI002892D0BC|nr:NADH dehydrogenase [ubiquinone] 1 alpha subcomplex subunit 10, mitochondrial [Phlebotomus argentipes]
MAGVLRISVGRFLPSAARPAAVPCVQQKCGISGKTIRGSQKLVKPPPYPYKTKRYGFFQALFDHTTKRLDDNSKIIVVEGPLAAGKSKFAKELADELEMHYIPAAHIDALLINPYGQDFRSLDDKLPLSVQSYDEKKFCQTPKHLNTAGYQIDMYYIRFWQYVEALQHVLNTGQGVVLDRCVYSDMVFIEAMAKNNYVSRGARSVYYDVRKNTIGELMQPHLVIYLDVSVEQTKKNIQKRGHAHEQNAPALTDQYLRDMESFYKQLYLKDISMHAELLVYDWNEGGETEVVAEDIERIDFDRFDQHDPKMKDWRLQLEWDWNEVRMGYSVQRHILEALFNVPRTDVPELLVNAEDADALRLLQNETPGMIYAKGYNKEKDGNLMWKL